MEFYQFFLISICNCIFLLCSTSKAQTASGAVFYDGPAVVNESDQFSLTCFTSHFPVFKWRRNGGNIDFGNSDSISRTDTKNDTSGISNLMIKSVFSEHSGNYKCTSESDDYGHNLTVIFVPAMKLKIEFPNGVSPCRNTKIDGKNCIFGNLFGKLAIKCVNDGGPWNNSMSLTWYQSKDDENPNTSNYELVKGTDDGRVKVSDGLLEISQLSNSDIAYYACKVTLKRSISEKEELVPLAQEVVEVQALPLVTPAVKDTTVVEGNTINVTCSVTGKASGVSWKFGGKPIDVNDSRVTMHPFKGVANATVLIQHANSTTDRGLYNCTAYSRYGNSKEGSIHVRIKSKYAALAPFLGIVAEVIILCTIILIYEKKRDKTELEESDTDQGPETKSSPDHGQDSVRYRK